MNAITRPATSARQPMSVGTAIRWLSGVFLLSVAAVLGLLEFFSHLQDDLLRREINEQARLFIGEEIVRGIHEIEKDFYRMTMATNNGGARRARVQIDRHADKLLHDMEVLKRGGTVRRLAPLNLEGHDDILREATYQPRKDSGEFTLEQIEIVPLLDQLGGKASELQTLLEQRWQNLDSGNRNQFFLSEEGIALFLKQLPPYFERLEENANRLFFEGDRELRRLQGELQTQRRQLKFAQIGLITLVVMLAGISGVLFLRRIDDTNRRLQGALGEAIAARNETESLREQNTTILNTLGDGIYATDLDGRITFMNRAAERILGWREEELLGQGVHAAIHHHRPDGRPFPAEECPLLSVRRSATPLRGDDHFIARDGRIIPVAFHAIPLLRNNALAGSLVSFQDVGEKQKSEALIRLQKAALDAAANMIVITARNGVIEYVNQAFCHTTGYLVEEVLGRHSRILKSGRHEQTFYENMWSTLLAGDPWEGEIVNRRKDGGEYAEQMTITPIFEDGEITHFVAIKRDITEESITKTRLKLIETAIRNIGQGLLITNTEFTEQGNTILYTNPGFTQITGYAAEEAVGRGTSILYDEETERRVIEELRNALRDGRSFAGETTFRRKDGSHYHVDLQCSPVRDDKGRITHYIGLISDISQRKHAEEALRQARDQALEASRLKSEFLSTMSHEIRTPMNGIIGMTDLLLDTRLDSEQRDFAGIVRDSAQSLLTIINDILDFSKIEAGRMDIEVTDFSPLNLVEGATELLAAKAREKSLALSATIDPSLPTLLRGDPVRVRQVLVNLVGNAIKFTERGTVRITVAPEEERRRIRFAVSDTGIGIAPATQGRLFQSFTQADSSTTRKYGGTGLGLAICKRLVELMGGEIGVVSAEGQGSTFWFTLPLQAAADVDEDTPRPSQVQPLSATLPDPAIREALKNHRLILLAEDNPTNQKVAQLQLNRLGYAVHVVSNGQEAVEAAACLPYSAILMDCQMPVMDGFEATVAIRRAESAGQPHVPIIAMTANAMQGDRERCLAVGMEDYVSKPFSPEQLERVLAAWVAKPLCEVPEQPPAPAVVSEELNFAHLEEMFGDDPALIAELLEVFRSTTGPLIERIEAAAEHHDSAALKELAHEAKGACANLGLAKLAELAARLEAAARGNDWEAANSLCLSFAAAFADVAASIAKHTTRRGNDTPAAPPA